MSEKPFAITLDVGSSLANKTGSWRTEVPRYVHRMTLEEHSVYAPRDGHVPPVPEWKQMDLFKDVLPKREG